MSGQAVSRSSQDRIRLPSRKAVALVTAGVEVSDSVAAWTVRYLELAVRGVRSAEVASKIAAHLARFGEYVIDAYGHDRLSALVRRDVVGWRDHLAGAGALAPATVNAHLASLSAFTTWVDAQNATVLPHGDPTTGVRGLALPALEPRALTEAQVRSLKSVLDRLGPHYQLKGRRRASEDVHGHGRPCRDRAIVYLLLSTGLRREELVRLNLTQVTPDTPGELRAAKRVRISGVRGKGATSRHVFVSSDARAALADYLERERPRDADAASDAVFLSAASIASRRAGGRLSPRSINTICEQIGRWHDAEHADPVRHVSPLRPHDLRHTFAFRLAAETGADAYELQRRLGHASGRYIDRYTNPPEQIAAGYIERM